MNETPQHKIENWEQKEREFMCKDRKILSFHKNEASQQLLRRGVVSFKFFGSISIFHELCEVIASPLKFKCSSGANDRVSFTIST